MLHAGSRYEVNTIVAKLVYMYAFERVNTEMDLYRDWKMNTMWEILSAIVRMKEWGNAGEGEDDTDPTVGLT